MNKELLQQTLDALNDSLDCVATEYAIYLENYGGYPSRKARIDMLKSGVDKHKAAIKALESAIAQPEQGKLLQIIAAMYQIAGAYDAPEHVLDVLANPEGATQEQIDSLLPFNIAQPMPATSAKPEPTTWHKTDTDGWSASHESNDNTCQNAITNGKITLLVVSRDDNDLLFDEAGEAHDKSVADVLRILNATHCAITTGTEPTEAMIEAYFQTVTAMFHDSETERIRCGLRAAIANKKATQ